MSKKKEPSKIDEALEFGRDLTVDSLTFIQKQEQQNIESVSDKPDIKSAAEALKIQNEKLQLDNQDLRQNIELRKLYALLLFILLSVWLSAILTIIFLSGFKLRGFALSQLVLVTLITTTTGMVVGFFIGVTNYLFPAKNSIKK